MKTPAVDRAVVSSAFRTPSAGPEPRSTLTLISRKLSEVPMPPKRPAVPAVRVMLTPVTSSIDANATVIDRVHNGLWREEGDVVGGGRDPATRCAGGLIGDLVAR